MTRDDILEAAFTAWGQDAYRTMSLSDVAARLGVTKPALYRHFKSKDELMNAMMKDFFDRFIVRLHTLIAEAYAPGPDTVTLLDMVEGFADYYARGKEDLVFTFARLLGVPDPEKLIIHELSARGITAPAHSGIHDERTARLHFALSTCFFTVAVFHFERCDATSPPTENEIARAVSDARSIAARGLAFPPESLAMLDYPALERLARLDASETAPGDGLLPAIASAVAEAGPWNASMELVARRSGLSKSGLYAHYRSREEMLKHLFLSEFERISAVMADRALRSENPVEQLYLAMAAAAHYLSERQDVLVALDWIRAQRVHLGREMPETITILFGFLSEAAARGECRLPAGRLEPTIRWILFLLVNMLMRTRRMDQAEAAVQSRLRALHANVCVGLEGW